MSGDARRDMATTTMMLVQETLRTQYHSPRKLVFVANLLPNIEMSLVSLFLQDALWEV
jgi:hypothetical protein